LETVPAAEFAVCCFCFSSLQGLPMIPEHEHFNTDWGVCHSDGHTRQWASLCL